MTERCDKCADWRTPDAVGIGECWSGDRLDGDMSKGPAGYSYGWQMCEAFNPAEISRLQPREGGV